MVDCYSVGGWQYSDPRWDLTSLEISGLQLGSASGPGLQLNKRVTVVASAFYQLNLVCQLRP